MCGSNFGYVQEEHHSRFRKQPVSWIVDPLVKFIPSKVKINANVNHLILDVPITYDDFSQHERDSNINQRLQEGVY